MSLNGRVALITGSSRGLGLAIAEALHDAGAQVVINYINSSSEQPAREIARTLNGMAMPTDVTDPAAVQNLFRVAELYFGQPISIVVNNALGNFSFNGDARRHLEDIEWSDFDVQLQTTLRGALNTTKAALSGFRKLGGGRIINIGSNLVQNPVVPYQDYTAAKGALMAFTRTSAAELGPSNVTVNMVSGGLLRVTDASSETPEEVFEQVRTVTPLRKVTRPEDLAGAVVFFAGPGAAAVTGQNLIVDGGLCMN